MNQSAEGIVITLTPLIHSFEDDIGGSTSWILAPLGLLGTCCMTLQIVKSIYQSVAFFFTEEEYFEAFPFIFC